MSWPLKPHLGVNETRLGRSVSLLVIESSELSHSRARIFFSTSGSSPWSRAGETADSGSTEAEMLTSHLRYWMQAITEIAPDANLVIQFSPFDSPVARERFTDTVVPALQPLAPRATLQLDMARQRARGYYGSGAMRIEAGGGEIGDGGFTDWTAKLMADNKERCLISCIATERLAALATTRPDRA